MRDLRIEDEIIANWKGDIEKPVISICCLTYNHELYIEDAIEGFLIQQTDFPFEILIHDDASTDRTVDIIREYEAKYPRIIKPIYQIENQFSKGVMLNKFNFKKAKGNYIALCHGDDYWTCETKLAKQLEVMNKTGVSICGHPAREIDVEGTDLKRITGYQVSKTSKFDPKLLIKQNGNMLPYGSIMITAGAKEDILANMPPVVFHTGIQMLCALRGGIAVIPDIMLAYRTSVPGSTTEIMLGDITKKLNTTKKRITSIKYLKRMYGDQYAKVFDKLLSNQITPFISHQVSYIYAYSLLCATLKNESIKSKLKILLEVFINVVVKMLKLMIRALLSSNFLKVIFCGVKNNFKKLTDFFSDLFLLFPFNKEKVPLKFFSTKKNVGDALNLYLIEKISGKKVISIKSGCYRHILGIGSIMHFASRKSIVWGAGIIDENILPTTSVFKEIKYSAVRGKKTQDFISTIVGSSLKCPLGDPAVLMPLYYTPKSQKKYRLGIVPHYVDKREASFKGLLKTTNAKVIDVELPVEEFLNELAECELVLSSSLHGLILSDSYNIPNVWVRFSDKLIGGDFKFLDYYSTTDVITPTPVDIRNLSFESDDEVLEILLKAKVASFMEDKKLLLESFPREFLNVEK
ncbi:glycosyltransferase [Marinomonas algarum]|uniref:Glycosyltransferase n=1 Tax=Marinomonas algarum TaxID=2883105 RepID=A0A9X1IL54_9GAMM|nr:glycosyltransferase [Marinomonas algarum]MCB5161514.1 glycosyltransferase [Marinomonas algarum]